MQVLSDPTLLRCDYGRLQTQYRLGLVSTMVQDSTRAFSVITQNTLVYASRYICFLISLSYSLSLSSQ